MLRSQGTKTRSRSNGSSSSPRGMKGLVQFRDNRFQNGQMLQLKQLIHQSPKVKQLQGKVMQLESKVTYGALNNMKAGDYNIKVGSKVHAHLDPEKPLVGSSTAGFSGWGKNFYKDMKSLTKESWVAGHLINHDLGGRGVVHNFFPITKKANSLHLHEVEYPVKGWISDGHTVDYTVEADKIAGSSSPNPSGFFNCTAEVTKTASGKSKPGKIHKQIQSMTEVHDGQRAKYYHYDDNEITTRGRRGVPHTWSHESGSKKDRDYERRFGTGGWWNSNDTKKGKISDYEFGKFEDVLSDEHEDVT